MQPGAKAAGWAWWTQFPAPLRALARVRLIAMLGAGGVLYLTPMVFHREAFSASSVGDGLALAALAGTVSRLVSGVLLDRGWRSSWPVALAALFAIGGDSLLLGAVEPGRYQLGQLLLGISMGLYWPAIELAVPLCCPPMRSARAFALVRSADALGVVLGALIGALLAAVGRLRGIYLVDITGLITVLLLVLRQPLPAAVRHDRRWPSLEERPQPLRPPLQASSPSAESEADKREPAWPPGLPPLWRRLRPPLATWAWLAPLLPLLLVTVLATALPALMQSALPLDLVRGGLQRPPLPEQLGALTIGLQLGLLLLLQWPVGQALARRPVAVGLSLSLVCFCLGCALLALSALHPRGVLLLLLAQVPLALGEAAFLPTATEALVELSPLHRQGLAMALFSQCFALSALIAPLVAGHLLDAQGHGAGLWLATAVLCLTGLPLVRRLERFQRRNLLQVLSGSGAIGGERRVLYRFEPGAAPRPDGGAGSVGISPERSGTLPAGARDQQKAGGEPR